jgi:uncharacterized protein YbjT (DUF2867 family)
MKIVVIGGTGLSLSKTVERLRKKGHEVLAASPNGGVNTITGEGLAEALAGAQAVIDLDIALSIVGAERLPDSGYMRAKMAQERLIRDSGIPYTIVHFDAVFRVSGRHRPVRFRRRHHNSSECPFSADRV